jgi:DsbC/DsbD-like thiol-disulfide interchange protein
MDALPPGMQGAEVLGGWQTPSGSRMVALRIALDAGWKTYWRAPGDAGIPPQFNFAASQNVAGVTFFWPTPEVFDQNGMRSVGYDDELILPIEIVPTDPAKPINLAADLDFGICQEICVPVSLAVSADLDGPGAPDPMIRAALSDRPELRPGRARCIIEPISDGVRVTAAIDLPATGQDEIALFELASTPVWVSDSVAHRDGDTLTATAEFVPENAQPFLLDRDDLLITVLSSGKAVEISGCAE